MSESDHQPLENVRVGISIAPSGTEEVEFTEPKGAVSDAGGSVDARYAGDGQFHHQKRRSYTKRSTPMRWCQTWMAYAVSTYRSEKYHP